MVIILSKGGLIIMDLVQFGSYIKNLRKEKGLTLSALASLSGISHPYLSQIENAKLKNFPSSEKLIKIANQLGVHYEVLLKAAGYLESEIDKNYFSHQDELNKNLQSALRTLSRDGYFLEEVQLEIFKIFSGNMSFGPDDFDKFYNSYLLDKIDDPDYEDEQIEEEFIKHYNYDTVVKEITDSNDLEWKEELLKDLINLAKKHELNINLVNEENTRPIVEKELSRFLAQSNISYKGHNLSEQQITLIKAYLDALITN